MKSAKMVSEHTKEMKKFLTVVVAFLCLFSVSPVRAWDDVGHKITGYIAWQRMTPQARARVIEILRQAPEDSTLAALYRPYGVESEATRQMEYFMLATTWADIVRDFAADSKFRNEIRTRKYHRSNWHYDDTFWRQVNGRVEEISGMPEGGVGVSKLNEFNALIRGNASDREKAIPTAWIMHVLGDLHQPLHTSARVTDTEPKGDQGGNLFLLTPKGTERKDQVNLHWFWDSIVGRNVPFSTDKSSCEREYIAELGQRFMKKHPYNTLQAGLNAADFAALQKETFALNPSSVFTPDLVRFSMPSEKYRRRAFTVAERQLALAGYRMAEIFNQAFGSSPAAAGR
jgi:hypothetical protein